MAEADDLASEGLDKPADDGTVDESYQPTAEEQAGHDQRARLYTSADAQVWAQEWCANARTIVADGGEAIDEGWMIGWFANAMWVGEIQGAKSRLRALDQAIEGFKERGLLEGVDDIETAIYQAIGAASLCWETTPTGIFDSTQAQAIGDTLIRFFHKILGERLVAEQGR